MLHILMSENVKMVSCKKGFKSVVIGVTVGSSIIDS